MASVKKRNFNRWLYLHAAAVTLEYNSRGRPIVYAQIRISSEPYAYSCKRKIFQGHLDTTIGEAWQWVYDQADIWAKKENVQWQ